MSHVQMKVSCSDYGDWLMIGRSVHMSRHVQLYIYKIREIKIHGFKWKLTQRLTRVSINVLKITYIKNLYDETFAKTGNLNDDPNTTIINSLSLICLSGTTFSFKILCEYQPNKTWKKCVITDSTLPASFSKGNF